MKPGERAAAWAYRGIWRIIVNWFNIPEEPPRLPGTGERTDTSNELDAFKPSLQFLKYMKLGFWIWLFIIDAAILVPWSILTYYHPIIGMILAPVAWGIAIVPDILVYIGLHLRYDTTWYLLTDRALRIRSGIWVIKETTITYENIQNVTVHQGPFQRFFGISNVVVRTAGGGASAGGKGPVATHLGLIEGIANAAAIRDRIMDRVRQSRTTGLGDERVGTVDVARRWTAEHVRVLREIRELVAGPV